MIGRLSAKWFVKVPPDSGDAERLVRASRRQKNETEVISILVLGAELFTRIKTLLITVRQ